MRLVDGLCLALAIGGAAYVYDVKHEAEGVHDQRRALERDIAALRDEVGLLEADLAALENPVRLQGLLAAAPESFDLEPIASTHYLRLSDLPFRSAVVDEATAALGEAPQEATTELPSAPETNAGTGIDALLETLLGAPDEALQPLPPALVGASTPTSAGTATDSIGALLEARP